LNKLHNKTIIVVWKGVDGAGKTTLLNKALEILISKNFKVLTYKTPSATPSGVFAKKYGEEELKQLLRLIERIGFKVFLKPDLYVIVDVKEEDRKRRLEIKESQGGIEEEIEKNIEIQEQVRRFYKIFYELRPLQTVWIVNAEGELENNTKIIVEKLLEIKKLRE